MILGTQPTNTLENATLSATCFQPFDVTTKDGKPARVAIIDADGNIIEAGPAVANELWNLMTNVYKQFLIGKGHVRVFAGGGK